MRSPNSVHAAAAPAAAEASAAAAAKQQQQQQQQPGACLLLHASALKTEQLQSPAAAAAAEHAAAAVSERALEAEARSSSTTSRILFVGVHPPRQQQQQQPQIIAATDGAALLQPEMVRTSTRDIFQTDFLSQSRGALDDGPAFCLPALTAAAAAAAAGGEAHAAAAAALRQRPVLTEPLWITQGKTNYVWVELPLSEGNSPPLPPLPFLQRSSSSGSGGARLLEVRIGQQQQQQQQQPLVLVLLLADGKLLQQGLVGSEPLGHSAVAAWLPAHAERVQILGATLHLPPLLAHGFQASGLWRRLLRLWDRIRRGQQQQEQLAAEAATNTSISSSSGTSSEPSCAGMEEAGGCAAAANDRAAAATEAAAAAAPAATATAAAATAVEAHASPEIFLDGSPVDVSGLKQLKRPLLLLLSCCFVIAAAAAVAAAPFALLLQICAGLRHEVEPQQLPQREEGWCSLPNELQQQLPSKWSPSHPAEDQRHATALVPRAVAAPSPPLLGLCRCRLATRALEVPFVPLVFWVAEAERGSDAAPHEVESSGQLPAARVMKKSALKADLRALPYL
ncbi:hypothetical protein ACSSS7_000101 [Eimeria intestinalis]